MIVTIIAIVAGVAWATFLLGKSIAFRSTSPSTPISETVEQVLVRVQRENDELRGQVAALEQRMRIEAASHRHVEDQLKALTEQNASLKEELAFFQALGGSGVGVGIQKFTVSPEPNAGEYRYRLLVVQSRQRAEHFRGRVEFIAYMVDKDKESKILFPQQGEKLQPYALGFKFFQRMEGVLKVSPTAKLTRVEVKVLEGSSESPVTSQIATMN